MTCPVIQVNYDVLLFPSWLKWLVPAEGNNPPYYSGIQISMTSPVTDIIPEGVRIIIAMVGRGYGRMSRDKIHGTFALVPQFLMLEAVVTHQYSRIPDRVADWR